MAITRFNGLMVFQLVFPQITYTREMERFYEVTQPLSNSAVGTMRHQNTRCYGIDRKLVSIH